MNLLLMNLSRDFSGGERQTLLLAVALREFGVKEAILLCVAGSPLHDRARESGVAVFPMAGGGLGKLRDWLRLRWFLRRNPGKWILHTHDNASVSLGVALSRKQPDLLLMHTRHTPEKAVGARAGEKLRAGRLVICETQEIAYAMAEAKVSPHTLKIVHGGIDADNYGPRLERNDGRLIIACPGRLAEGNGHETLIRALAPFREAWQKEFPPLASMEQEPSLEAAQWPWEVRFTGNGAHFRYLLDLARQLGVERHLAFLGAQDSKEVLPCCDLLVAPAEAGEGCSLPLLEGWSMRLPVLCSDSMAHQEMASNGMDSMFFAHGSPEDLAEKMLLLARDSELRGKLAEGGAQSVRRFSHTLMAESYLKWYRRLIAEC